MIIMLKSRIKSFNLMKNKYPNFLAIFWQVRQQNARTGWRKKRGDALGLTRVHKWIHDAPCALWGVKVASYIFDFFATCRPPPGSGCRQRPPPTVLREKKNQKCPPILSVRKKTLLSATFTVPIALVPLDAFTNIIFSSALSH